jgi:hypothetical protein
MTQRLKWWHSEWRERQLVNEAASELQGLDLTVEGLTGQVRRLAQLGQEQGQQIVRLQAVVDLLLDLVVEKGLVDADHLRDRVQTVLAALEPPPPPVVTAAAGPYRSGPAPLPAPERQTACVRCGQQVPLSKTVMTAEGEVCDACHLRGQRP